MDENRVEGAVRNVGGKVQRLWTGLSGRARPRGRLGRSSGRQSARPLRASRRYRARNGLHIGWLASAPDRDAALRDCFFCARHRMASGPDASALVTRKVLRRKKVTAEATSVCMGEWPTLESMLFFAGLVVVACCVLGGLYLLFRHTSRHDKLTRRKPPLANWK